MLGAASSARAQRSAFQLTARDYLHRDGVDVMAFQDFYPDGHQGGVTIVQHGVRVAGNGDVRLEPTPGQWSPMPQQNKREVRRATGEIVTTLSFPDTSKDRHGFNPIIYPDFKFGYQVRVRGEGDAVHVYVDLDTPLPAAWAGRVGFNLELYPTDLFGKSWYIGSASGIFPRQPDGPMQRDAQGELQAVPLGSGPRITIAPETETQRLIIESRTGDLQLLDGRNKHNNGWFIVRSTAVAGATKGAIEWVIRPHGIPGWREPATVQVSQVGYHPAQKKIAVVELDAAERATKAARLYRVSENGGLVAVLTKQPTPWGEFLRYRYAQLDFSGVTQPGMYVAEYDGVRTHPFRIGADVYARGAWQPTIDYFLPAQMCHMRVEEQYRVWHGVDHLDDARMAYTDSNHFDGYRQGPSTLTTFKPGERVPGLDRGGWHDAGDDDLRIESQADETYILASMYELFGLRYDNTTVDQARRLVLIHQPDGTPDLLQQAEHGILNILGGYRALGRLYRGVIVPTLHQYVLLGDESNSSDNLFYDATLAAGARTVTTSSVRDDRMVFTEQNPGHEYKGIAALAIVGRVLKDYNPTLARESAAAAEALWHQPREQRQGFDDKIVAAVELFLTTGKPEYRDTLLALREPIVARIGSVGWVLGRALPAMRDSAFTSAIRTAVATQFATVVERQKKTPYGVPYEPVIWGAAWGVQAFGVQQYYLHRAFPDVVNADYLLNALNFILGVHPGRNTRSFASGVGSESMTTAYGFNRADWSYIPGGVVSGTNLIRPDLPELKNYPFLWQQAEYVMGGGATNYMFLALAADQVLNEKRSP
ncbi:MAG: glycoside hydrolase family 9, partial [Gemmatimonadetes bacterium]|nr:glycoside hydrolase family 9 [Gemmatimonadota bacterium]